MKTENLFFCSPSAAFERKYNREAKEHLIILMKVFYVLCMCVCTHFKEKIEEEMKPKTKFSTLIVFVSGIFRLVCMCVRLLE